MGNNRVKKTKRSKKIVWILSAILFVIAFSLLITSIVFQKNNKAYLFGYRIYYISTGSMEPDIAEGSIAVVKKTDPADIKVGDVISFISSDPAIAGNINTHAVYAIEEDEQGLLFTTKGTANPVPDEYKVRPDDITGVVASHSKTLGKVFGALSNRTLLFVLTIVPLAVIVLYSLIELIINIYKPYPDEAGEQPAQTETAPDKRKKRVPEARVKRKKKRKGEVITRPAYKKRKPKWKKKNKRRH